MKGVEMGVGNEYREKEKHTFGHFRLDVAGQYGIHPDAFTAKLEGERGRQTWVMGVSLL